MGDGLIGETTNDIVLLVINSIFIEMALFYMFNNIQLKI